MAAFLAGRCRLRRHPGARRAGARARRRRAAGVARAGARGRRPRPRDAVHGRWWQGPHELRRSRSSACCCWSSSTSSGHFIAAKAVGMRALQVLHRLPAGGRQAARGGDTEYGIGAIPLGGFVKILGMLRPERATCYAIEDMLGHATGLDAAAALRLAADADATSQRCLDQGRLRRRRARPAGACARRRSRRAAPALTPVQLRLARSAASSALDEDLDPRAYWRARAAAPPARDPRRAGRQRDRLLRDPLGCRAHGRARWPCRRRPDA